MYVSGLWFGVAPRMDIKKTCVEKYWSVCVQNIMTVLGSTININ
jgi:hypothetical protein